MNIGVIGAGISGMTLAAALRRLSPETFVFADQRGRPLLELPATGDEKRLNQRVKRQALKAALLEADIVSRGRKAVLESRNAARQFYSTSRRQPGFRNLGFLFGNLFIGMATRKAKSAA